MHMSIRLRSSGASAWFSVPFSGQGKLLIDPNSPTSCDHSEIHSNLFYTINIHLVIPSVITTFVPPWLKLPTATDVLFECSHLGIE